MGGLEEGQGVRGGVPLRKPTYRLIQILRAVAALMVVAHHATILLSERDHLPSPNWRSGNSGVDIFFVISGFVMTISSASLRFAERPERTFLTRRLERVVPLYWIVTTLKVVVLLLFPALALNGLGSLQHVVGSYLFFPVLSGEGRFEPVVVVGWTLNFEMAFYLLFAVALAWRRRPAWLLVPLLVLLPLMPVRWMFHLPLNLWFYWSTVLWEFAFGMVLGVAAHHVRRLPQWIGWVLIVGAIQPLVYWAGPSESLWRGGEWGIPALALVMGAVILEERWGGRSPRWALELGDASYSIYLVHTFTLPALAGWFLLWPKWWGAHWPGEIVVAVVCLVVFSAAVGDGVYRLLERPMMLWFQGRRRSALPSNS